ncbi:hypothetical protein DMC18_01130 [Caulobacter sp. D5]|nr:hypothetical protein DMC18_01130 [Caulobacter sp. D5]
MIRATPTGVSAMIDAQGRVVGGQRLDLGQRGVIDANLPATGRDTFAPRVVDWPFLAFILASVAICIGSSRNRVRKFADVKDIG